MKIVLHYLPAALVALLWVGFAVWLFLRALQRSVDPAKLVFKWILTVVVGGASVGVCVGVGLQDYAGAFIVPITCAVVGILTALIWGENIATMLIAPLTSAIDGGQEAATPEPLYSIARSKRNRGEYQAAIHAIDRRGRRRGPSRARQRERSPRRCRQRLASSSTPRCRRPSPPMTSPLAGPRAAWQSR